MFEPFGMYPFSLFYRSEDPRASKQETPFRTAESDLSTRMGWNWSLWVVFVGENLPKLGRYIDSFPAAKREQGTKWVNRTSAHPIPLSGMNRVLRVLPLPTSRYIIWLGLAGINNNKTQ